MNRWAIGKCPSGARRRRQVATCTTTSVVAAGSPGTQPFKLPEHEPCPYVAPPRQAGYDNRRLRRLSMRILRFEVEGFRSLRQVDWHPGNLNVVIGPNGSGKSNLLRTLELLSVAASGGLGRYVKAEGGIDPLMWDGRASQIRVRCKLSPAEDWRDPDRDSYTYDLSLGRLGVSSAYRIDSEVLGNFHQVELRCSAGTIQASRTGPATCSYF